MISSQSLIVDKRCATTIHVIPLSLIALTTSYSVTVSEGPAQVVYTKVISNSGLAIGNKVILVDTAKKNADSKSEMPEKKDKKVINKFLKNVKKYNEKPLTKSIFCDIIQLIFV